MSRGTPIEVAKYRAKDLTPHDVIQVRYEQSYIWVEVVTVYAGASGAARLRDIARQNRQDYSRKTAPNIGIALFIDGYHETEEGKRLARLESGLSVVVETRLVADAYSNDNWFEFRSLALVDTQVVDL